MHDTATVPEYGRIPEACRRYGLSRSRLYALAGEGCVRFVKVGSATLVDLRSVHDYLAACPPARVSPPKPVA
jgi:excisionase family DNA binding protein